MPPEHKSQRTERPTPRRIKKARDQGQVARSRELPGVAGLVAFLIFAHLLGRGWLDRLQVTMTGFLTALEPELVEPDNIMAVCYAAGTSTAMLLFVPLGMLLAAGVAGNLVQGPPPLTLHPLKPQWDKLNPFKGIKKVISLRQWVDTLKGAVKMVLFGSVALTAARDALLTGGLSADGAEGALQMQFALAGTVLARVTAVAAALALLDYLFRRYDHTRNLMMSKREIKDERKQMEGDPMIRARIRQRQMALARSRMMADVAKATVVITNPTHYAVALRYEPGETHAPLLLAKGRGLIAERIRTIASTHRIPIVQDPPLARALFRSVAIGSEIPPGLFRAVAEVLALVMAKGRPRRRSGTTSEVRQP